MKRWGLTVVVAMSAAFSMFGVASASAATEFGDNCAADEVTEATIPLTLFAITAAGDPLSLTAPGSGVIVRWTLNQAPAEALAIPQTLRVLHPTGPETVQVVGESTQFVTGGSNSFETRIPVQTGDRLGLAGSGEKAILFCEEPGVENLLVLFENTGGVGSTGVIGEEGEIEAEARVPVSAVIEPDADNDGYGDETQDKCPTSAATHDACPTPPAVSQTPPTVPLVTLNARATARKGLAEILVTSSVQSQVTVVGAIKLGKHKTTSLHSGTQVVNPGVFAKFVLLFPKALKEKLKALSPKQSLTLKVTTTAPNSTGAITTNVKLKGQAKPAHRKGHHHKV